MEKEKDFNNLFGPDGPLARQLTGYTPRQAQEEMAKQVADAIDRQGCLIAEAGTGTGKTFAYLAPLLLSGQKAMISTATRNLQDQLFRKDLPMLRKAMGVPARVALLKGRSNYLCPYRLENAFGFRAEHGEQEARVLENIRRWAGSTVSGDIAEASGVPESSPIWQAATSTADNCLGQDCPKYNDCFVAKARREAQEADIVVINHHLLWADWTLRNDGFGEILPDVRVIVVDEAHQFLESAINFLGLSLSSRQLTDLASDIVTERFREARDVPALLEDAEQLDRIASDLRLALGDQSRRDAWHVVASQPVVIASLEILNEHLFHLAERLKPLAVRSKGLESCHKRSVDLMTRLSDFLSEENPQTVRWFETRKRGFALNRTPLEVSGEFKKFRESSKSAWIFASATLTVDGRFEHFTSQFGLHDAEKKTWESPFDYKNQCLLYMPAGLPDPGSYDYNRAFIKYAIPVLKASRGRAFLLFTSHQALKEAASLLEGKIDFPLYIQGTQPKATLLDLFRKAGNAVLLGTSSFWEGVDVQGPALSCVIIDKLPFASPGDPVLAARLESMRRSGRNPFVSQQLPQAIITLKQGVGRLIRHRDDRGVLMLCDPRLTSRSYGKMFLSSLPDIPRTNNIATVEHFFSEPENTLPL